MKFYVTGKIRCTRLLHPVCNLHLLYVDLSSGFTANSGCWHGISLGVVGVERIRQKY